jgi:hypothetical protein
MLHYKLIRVAAIPLIMILYASTAEAGVIAWYPLHGDATANVGNDGVLVLDADGNAPTPAMDENGKANGALLFAADPNNSPAYSGSNTGSYVSVAGGAGLAGIQQGTIAMWVNWSGMQGLGWQNRHGAVIARQSNGKYSNNVLGLSDADPNVATLTWQPYSANPPIAVGSTPVGDNVWHFVAVTFDGTSGEQDLYLDGNLDGVGFATLQSMNTDTNAPLTIGAWYGDGATYSNSTVHSVFIFDTVLSQTDIQNLQATGVPYRHP